MTTREELIRKLEERGNIGADLSPGDELSAAAARELKQRPRKKLPDRRGGTTIEFRHRIGISEQAYLVTVGFYPDDGQPGELFINTSGRAGSESDTNVSDAAVAASLALQYGCPLDLLRRSMKHDADGSPTGPLGRALLVVEQFLSPAELLSS